MDREMMDVNQKRYYKLCFLIICLIIVAMFTGCKTIEVDSDSKDVAVASETEVDTKLIIKFEGENVNPDIVIETNLPDKTELKIRLFCEQKDYEVEKTISVLSGRAKTNLIGILDKSLTPGEYSVTVKASPENQQRDVLRLIGEKGENLVGENVLINTKKNEKYLYKQINYIVTEKDFFDSNPTENARTFYALEKAVQQEYGMNYRIITKQINLIEVTVWSDGSLKVYKQMGEDFDSNIREWYETREKLQEFTSKLREIVESNLIEVNLVSQSNSQTPLLIVTCGTVSYDETQKGLPVRLDNARLDDLRIDYTGVVGYIGIENDPDDGAYDPAEDKEFATTIWTIPTYQKDKQFYVINGTIEHKTKVQVVSQDLIDKGNYYSKLYLTVRNMETGEESIIL